jgi:hypothetical protein
VEQGDVPGGYSTSRQGPIPERAWRMAAVVAACLLAAICGYRWAMPVDSQSIGMQVTGPLMATLLIVIAWRDCFLFARPSAGFRKRVVICVTLGMFLRSLLSYVLVFLLVALAERVPAVWPAAGGWPGGWAFGMAGLVAGALMGAAIGWLLRILIGPLVTIWYVAEPRTPAAAES